MKNPKMVLSPLSLTIVNGRPTGALSPNRDAFGSPLSSTYRTEGLSIGRDYMRYEGSTLSRSLGDGDLVACEVLGRGGCSVVRKARLVSRPGRSGKGVMGPLGEGPEALGSDNVDGITETGRVCEENTDGQCYALKAFPVRDRERREMLAKELRVLCSLRCDCLVGLIGAFFESEDRTVTMVLEYMDRGSLADLLHLDCTSSNGSASHGSSPRTPRRSSTDGTFPRGLSEPAVASIAYQMSWGLAYLHHERVLHRDVKPANVLVNSRGCVKLSDFGISSRQTEEDAMSETVVGTARYMSPERLSRKRYGPSSDIWSLGLVLAECATGRSPLGRINSMVELVLTIEETSVEDLIAPELSKGLREVLFGCLQSSPERRMPAKILVKSPWFGSHGIAGVGDASKLMQSYLLDRISDQENKLS